MCSEHRCFFVASVVVFLDRERDRERLFWVEKGHDRLLAIFLWVGSPDEDRQTARQGQMRLMSAGTKMVRRRTEGVAAQGEGQLCSRHILLRARGRERQSLLDVSKNETNVALAGARLGRRLVWGLRLKFVVEKYEALGHERVE